MTGTMVFGAESSNRLADSFATDFSTLVYDEVLFMTADCSKWVLTSQSNMAGGWNGNGKLDVIGTSENGSGHQITVQE